MNDLAAASSQTSVQLVGSLWKNSVFTKLFAAYSLSTFGDWFDLLAISVLVGFVWHADPMMMSLVPLAMAVPGILCGQLAGHLADRSNKVRILILCDAVSCLLTIALVFAPNMPILLFLLFLRSTAGVFNYPAQQALTRNVVAPQHLLQASSYNGGVNQLGKVLGPLLGSAVLAYFSPQLCLYLNAASFLLSALILSGIGKINDGPSQSEANTIDDNPSAGSWKEGWRIIMGSRMLLVTIILTYIGYFIIQLVDFQFPLVFREYAPDEPHLLAWAMTAIGMGSIIPILILSRLKDIPQYGVVLSAGFILSSGFYLSMGLLYPGFPVWMLLSIFFVGGNGGGLKITCANFIIQKETPPDAMGRVAGITSMIGSAVVVTAPLLGGVLISTLGASGIFITIGLLMLAFGLIGLLFGKRLFRIGQEEAVSPSL